MDSQTDAEERVLIGAGFSPTQKLTFTLTVAVVATAAAWFVFGMRKGADDAAQSRDPAAAAARDSGVEEWRSHPGYIGSAVCRQCHEEQFASYSETAHSRALSPIVPDDEPPDAVLDHPASRYRFRTSRVAGRMIHEASLLLADGTELGHVQHELTHRVGSGHVSRTYLAVADGLFVESPLTWWESWQRWGMSPGYDVPRQRRFNRVVDAGCLFCHAGNVETSAENDFRLRLLENAIGCERCHGPGKTHVDLETAGRDAQGATDGRAHRAIVHPRRLPRAAAEAICQQCHRQADIQVPGFGVRQVDFQPGESLETYRHDYRIRKPRTDMDIVEHSEQLAHSACYRRSETLTCVTCHNPHAVVLPADRVAHYRAACLACHRDEDCREPLAERVDRSQNDCVTCHMPRKSTIMPHVAFTHHQIGVHPLQDEAKSSTDVDRLMPLFDLERLSEGDRQRSLGLAWVKVFASDSSAKDNILARRHAADRAEHLLTTLPAEFVDAAVWAALADLFYLQDDMPRAEEAAHHVLELASASSQSRMSALAPLGTAALMTGRSAEGADYFAELTRLRRDPDDWFLLGVCEHLRGAEGAAIQALNKSVELDLASIRARELLTEIHHSRKEFDKEQRLREEIDRLNRSPP
ncbi:MAG TPA: cytochrome c3 family protein [Planctomycetaceae bacterium]